VQAEEERKRRQVEQARLVAERGRRRAMLAAAVAGLLLLTVLAGAGLWYQQHQAAQAADEKERQLERQHQRDLTEQNIAAALMQARQHRAELHRQLAKPGGVFHLLNQPLEWKHQLDLIRESLKHASEVEAGATDAIDRKWRKGIQALEELVKIDEADRQLALDLEKVSEEKAIWVNGSLDHTAADPRYSKIFQKTGLAIDRRETRELTTRIQNSPIKEKLLATLDDWALSAWVAGKRDLAKRLLTVARRMDPGPWGDEVRDLNVWQDEKKLQQLVTRLQESSKTKGGQEQLSPQMLHLIGLLLPEQGGAESWLRQAVRAHPADFWLNFELANVLYSKKNKEALGYFRVALVLRPRCTVAHINLGLLLKARKDYTGAIYHYEKAIKIDPRNVEAHNNLGVALHDQGQFAAAIPYFKKALDIKPTHADAHVNWGNALARLKDFDGAIAQYKQALRFNPKHAPAHCNIGHLLAEKGYFGEALEYLQKGHELGSRQSGWIYNSAGWIKQCQELLQLDEQMQAVRQGRAQAGGSQELLAFANLCKRHKKYYATAARFYADALALKPQLAQDIKDPARYQAICCSVLAAAGQGLDAAALSATVKSKLRQQALDWLRMDLKRIRQELLPASAQGGEKKNAKGYLFAPANQATAKSPDRLWAKRQLSVWQNDLDLASVRLREELARLPAAEQQAWQRFWKDVAQLQTQAQP
jgi:tetratricopeptide (TPR) repeat protein